MSEIIWTNHLEQRLRERNVTRNEAYDTINYPDKSIKLGPKKWKFIKNYSQKQVVIVGVYEESKWIILTSWTKNLITQHQSPEPFLSRLVRKILIKTVNFITNRLR